MGFLSTFLGLPHPDLVEHGRPGRGLIIDLLPTGHMPASIDGTCVADGSHSPDEGVCVFILEVRQPGRRPFHTTTRQRFPHRLDQIEAGQTLVAVRVDPHERTRTTIVWNAPLVYAPETQPVTG